MTNKVKAFRLNRQANSNYALFIVDEEKSIVTFRQFRYYTGPLDKEQVLSLQDGRALYQKMLASRVKIHHHDKDTHKEWVAVPWTDLPPSRAVQQ